MEKFSFIEKLDFENPKTNKHIYMIRIFVHEINRSVVVFPSENVYNNYNLAKFNDDISKNKIVKESSLNKFGQVVITYKMIN